MTDAPKAATDKQVAYLVTKRGWPEDEARRLTTKEATRLMKRRYADRGLEPRGFPPFKIYPTRDEEEALRELRADLFAVWNGMCLWSEAFIDRQKQAGYAIIGQPPPRPVYDGMSPEEAKAAAERYRREAGAHAVAAIEAAGGFADAPKLDRLTQKYAAVTGRAFTQKYQFLSWYFCEDRGKPKIGALLMDALVHRWETSFRKGRKAPKSRPPHLVREMSIVVRSGLCVELGAFGARGKNEQYYNCRVKIPGSGLAIRGRLPGRMPGKLIEGVTVYEAPDGWYAAVKEYIETRPVPEPVPGSCIAMNEGRDYVMSFSDGRRIKNPRGRELSMRLAEMQRRREEVRKKAQGASDPETRRVLWGQVDQLRRQEARLHQKMARHTRHVVFNEIVKALATYERVFVEDVDGALTALGGSRKTSFMITTIRLLQARFGERVILVPPAYTSTTCSSCLTYDPETWEYRERKVYTCPHCGYRADRDTNAARNVLARGLDPTSTWGPRERSGETSTAEAAE